MSPILILTLALTLPWGASQATQEPAAPAAAHAEAGHGASHVRREARRSAQSVLEERVGALARTLDLDSGQKAQVREMLLAQRDRLRQIWADPARRSADRVGASLAINERTEDGIRSILNEEQRRKYIAPRAEGSEDRRLPHGVDYWMDQMQGPR